MILLMKLYNRMLDLQCNGAEIWFKNDRKHTFASGWRWYVSEFVMHAIWPIVKPFAHTRRKV